MPDPTDAARAALLDSIRPQGELHERTPPPPPATPPRFTRGQMALIGRGETLVSLDGTPHRPLPEWLVPAGDPAIQVRLSQAGMQVTVPRRRLDHPARLVPTSGPVIASLELGAWQELPPRHAFLTAQVDPDAGWMRLERVFDDARDRLRTVEALQTGDAWIHFEVNHTIVIDKTATPPRTPSPPAPRAPRTPTPRRPPPTPEERAELGRRLAEALDALKQQMAPHRTAVHLPPQSQHEILLCAPEPGWCTAAVESPQAAPLTIQLVAPDGSIRARSQGSPTGGGLLLTLRRSDLAAFGRDGWRVQLLNPTDQARELEVQHGLEPWTPPTDLHINARGELELHDAVLPPTSPFPDPPRRTVLTLPGKASGVRFNRYVTREFHAAAGTDTDLLFRWAGPAALMINLSSPGHPVLAMVSGRDEALVRLLPTSGPVTIAPRNEGDADIELEVLHSPGSLREPPPRNRNATTFKKSERRHDALPLQRSPDVDPAVFAGLNASPSWKPFPLPDGGSLWYRPVPDRLGEAWALPEQFRLGFVPTDSVPAVIPRLHLRAGHADPPASDDYRVEVKLGVVPWTDPASRDALRAHLQAAWDLPFVDLLTPPGLDVRYIDPAHGFDQSVQVSLHDGFQLDLDLPADPDWALLSAQLASGAGFVASVVLPRDGEDDIGIPVRLSLGAIVVSAIGVHPGREPGGVTVRNTCAEPVLIEGLDAWIIHRGEVGTHGALTLPRLGALRLGPHETRAVVITDEPLPESRTLRVQPRRTAIEGIDAAAWLRRINRQDAAPTTRSVTVSVTGTSSPGLLSIELWIRRDGAVINHVSLEPGSPDWVASLPADLQDHADRRAGLHGLVLEGHAVFVSGPGLLQRVPIHGEHPWLALPPESAGPFRIELLDADGEVTGVQTLDGSAAVAMLDERMLDDGLWRLDVAAQP